MSEHPIIDAELIHMDSRFKDVDEHKVILKLSTKVDGIQYRHLAGLPTEQHVSQFPDSMDDAIRGAYKRLQEKIDHGADQS